VAGAQFRERIHVVVCGQRADAEAIPVARDHVQRAAADRAGGAEEGDGLHSPSSALPSTNTGNAATSESMRSNNPPWPGNNAPESFTPAWRLTRLSNRSPMIEKATVTSASAMTPISKPGDACATQPPARPITAAQTSAPYTPAQVLPGLMDGASFRPPNRVPAKYAPLSAAITMQAKKITHQAERGGASVAAPPCIATTAHQAGTTTSRPANSFSATWAGVRSAAKRMLRSHSVATSHHATPTSAGSHHQFERTTPHSATITIA